ncbi:MAG: hypothetical protein AAF479_00100 [Pseudomonadota bacterium]
MKIVSMLAALALALAPALASAQSTSSDSNTDQAAGSPEPGGISQGGVLPVFSLASIPAGAIVVGSVVILAGVIIGVIASDDSTTSTTN